MKKYIWAIIGFLIIAILGFGMFYLSGKEEVRILFVGDTGFGENYYEAYGGVDLDEKGYEYSFENFRVLMNRAHFTVMNLETPLTKSTNPPLRIRNMHIGPILRKVDKH